MGVGVEVAREVGRLIRPISGEGGDGGCERGWPIDAADEGV